MADYHGKTKKIGSGTVRKVLMNFCLFQDISAKIIQSAWTRIQTKFVLVCVYTCMRTVPILSLCHFYTSVDYNETIYLLSITSYSYHFYQL